MPESQWFWGLWSHSVAEGFRACTLMPDNHWFSLCHLPALKASISSSRKQGELVGLNIKSDGACKALSFMNMSHVRHSKKMLLLLLLSFLFQGQKPAYLVIHSIPPPHTHPGLLQMLWVLFLLPVLSSFALSFLFSSNNSARQILLNLPCN